MNDHAIDAIYVTNTNVTNDYPYIVNFCNHHPCNINRGKCSYRS